MLAGSTKLGAVLAALFAASCKAQPTVCHDFLSDGGLSEADVERIVTQIKGGKEPCPELASPSIEVSERGVALDGLVIAQPSELPTGAGHTIPALFERMKSDRALWKRLHPGAEFDATFAAAFPANTDAAAGVSVLQSARYAGYTHVHLRVGAIELKTKYAAEDAPHPASDAGMCRTEAWVSWRSDGALDIRFGSRELETQTSNAKAAAGRVSAHCNRAWCTEGCEMVVIIKTDGGTLDTLVSHAREFLDEIHTTQIAFEVPGLPFNPHGWR